MAVRHWSLADATRIAIEFDADFTYRSDHLPNPERLFFDISGVKPTRVPKGIETIRVNDGLVRQIRVAETQPEVTRIVLDLRSKVEFSASRLSNPERLIIEVRPAGAAPSEPPPSQTTRRIFEPPQRLLTPVLTGTPRLSAAKVLVSPLAPEPSTTRVIDAMTPQPVLPPYTAPLSARTRLIRVKQPAAETPVATEEPVAMVERPAQPVETTRAYSAKRDSTGDRSMTRVLGLKLNRVVLDPGHGGHDVGTIGPSGLTEKDLVLDVAKRLGDLIADRLGSEVIYTRSDDTFVSLEERTRIANRHKADLFLSIHANSSPVRSASGVETYYLNFTTNRAALEVAARENASSERSIFELRDLLQKIALKDKLEESREFAARVQNTLSTFSVRSNANAKNRGVRKAPFVVLIGASMPSILSEIGFVSNPHDEALMKKPEYRQKLAEALYKGVAQYASSLSHFQVATQQRKADGE